MKDKEIKILNFVFILIILSQISFSSSASYEISVNISEINKSNSDTHFVIDNWEELPHKDQRAFSDAWLDTVNNQLEPKGADWWTFFTNIAMKCLSYGAATTNDWYSINTGKVLDSYTNILNGFEEKGTNPRELEQVYFTHNWWERNFDFSLIDDFVTHEDVPYDIKGYADILISPPSSAEWNNRPDSELWYPTNNFKYTIEPDEYVSDWVYIPVSTNKEEIKNALRKYGILYAHVKNNLIPYIWDLKVHSVAIIGYGIYGGKEVFWIHESYNSPYPQDDENTRYKAIETKYINEILKFYDPTWSTDHYNNRRTSFTLLKGDMHQSNIAGRHFVLQPTSVGASEYVSRPTIADIDGDGYMDVVVSSAITTGSEGYLFGLEFEHEPPFYSRWDRWRQKWKIPVSPMVGPSTLADLENNGNKDIVLAMKNGTMFVIDRYGNVDHRFTIDPKEGYIQSLKGSAVSDIDLDGSPDIILADYRVYSDDDWPGEVYVLDNSANEKFSATFNKGGALGAISIANLDSDDYPEIVVPAFYGVVVYDYNGGSLSQKCSTSHALIEDSVVIYDINKDNEYELIFTTSDYHCAVGKTCQNRLYILDSNCNEIDYVNLSIYSRNSPSIANLDSDSNMEMVIIGTNSDAASGSYLGNVDCYELSGSNIQHCGDSWPFNNSNTLNVSFSAPTIADITGDGNYNIIFGENEGKNLFVLNGDGTEEYNYELSGVIDTSIAVADIDNDKVAEITMKRAGSPVALLTMVTGENEPPDLDSIDNITAIAGDLINISITGQVNAEDPNGDDLSIYYSSPFNSSGLWQTSADDTGNYSILVETSDGNMSDYRYVDVIVFDQDTRVVDTFSDSSSDKLLNFTGTQNKTLTIRIPKNVSIEYSKIKIEGLAP